ncbi:2-phospho-L-lactate guanylyltransferase [Cryobacterium sp. CG_9.6]|uniref:2-phospho-L-lactate guanylyltransferase n=1 Tax=Cryobacterium sp. CG_9.6 TaxID=2760710 RepID=UPI00247386A7|nr:2-phospho-L-lactate guanylyltransferase [Cryobacterium sp. CG_9.6]MDH6235300.1 2-phospho-L-lactate guanylyltransferase [Cryobacterium sp. CG_9.6]
MNWIVVVPAKGNPGGKSRLGALPERAALAEAFALDTVSVLLGLPDVLEVFVVTGDTVLGAALEDLGAVTVPEEVAPSGPAADPLNAAIRQGFAAARAEHPGVPCVIVTGDLPALRREDFLAALHLASTHALSMVPDAAGTGTTALFVHAGLPPALLFGPGSRAAHEVAGYVPLAVPADSTLRRDVDTSDDLALALLLGLGPHSRAVLQAAAGTAAQ